MVGEAYGESAPTVKPSREKLQRFKSGDLSVEVKDHAFQLKKFEDLELDDLIDQDHRQPEEPLMRSVIDYN